MAKLTINLGTNPNDGTGDNLRGGGTKINANFTEIYDSLGDGTNLTNSIKFADTTSTLSTIPLGGTLKIVGGTGVDATISGDTLTLAADSSIMTSSGTVTMSNKTLALGSNTVSGTLAEFNTAVTDATLVSTTGSETLTNKDLTASTNTFTPITIVDDSSTASTIGLGETLKISGGAGITSTISGDTVTLAAGGLTNSSLSGSAGITNANLANSSVTIGSTAVALGASATSIAGLSLTGTGTIDLSGAGSKARFNFAGTGAFPNEASYEGMFAYDTTGNEAYVADAGGWTKLLNENSSVSAHSDVNMASIADGNALIWNSSNARFEPGSAGSTARYEDTAVRLAVSANSNTSYRFTSHYGTTDNPTLYIRQGQTIGFDLSALSGSHPFVLQTSSGAYVSGNRITTGLTHVATDGTVTTGVNAQGKTSGILYFDVPHDQSTIYYVCTAHSAMAGTLAVNPKVPGIANSQIWLLTSALSTTGNSSFADITANLSESALTGYGRLGDVMTVSSGVFTFPSTGIWEVEAIYNFSGAEGYGRGEIQVTTNNSSYTTVAQSQEETDNQEYANLAMMAQVDVTDTANVKVKFRAGGTVANLAGDSGYMRTGFKFKRLGDT